MSSNLIDINKLNDIAKQAGKILLSYYNDHGKVETKKDNSPVTIADDEANSYIVAELNRCFPDIPVVSEEGEHDAHGSHKFFLVDPLDGTSGFIRGKGQFTVNIGLIENKRPTAGVIYIPTEDLLYYSAGGKAYRNGSPIQCRKIPEKNPVVVASHSHLDEVTKKYIENLKIKYPDLVFTSAASSLKFCRLAEGLADIYPRFGRTMEWDTAAGHAILNAAGGKVLNPDGTEFTYEKNKIFENGNFIAYGSE